MAPFLNPGEDYSSRQGFFPAPDQRPGRPESVDRLLAALLLAAFLLTGVFYSPTVYSRGWTDLWVTPDQQRRNSEAKGEFDDLTVSDNPAWSGVGHYRKGDFGEAAKRFSEAGGDTGIYNEATSLIHAGEYDQAVSKLEDLLESNPEHQNARHNLDVARQLKELQQTRNEQGEDGDRGDQQNQDSQDSPSSGDQQSGDQDESSQQGDSEASDGEDSQSSESLDQPGENGEQPREEPEDETASAEDQQEDSEVDASDARDAQVEQGESPLSEDEQATEQWLRRIPDDPTGLLRRKLKRSQQIEYPSVVDGKNPW